MAINNQHAISVLNDLLTRNYDAEQGYKNAAEEVKNDRLKSFFDVNAQKRNKYGHTLKDEIRHLGGNPDKGGSAAGSMHRQWMDIRQALSLNDSKTVLNECKRGEKKAINDYESALNNEDLPLSTKAIIQRQHDEIVNDLEKIDQLEASLA